ncbi:MAG: YraN family protein [Candidatus Latescibacterota bacterium]|nr:MAG: YraN family protein [Candidatus Latescibacterota bacterium]
MNTKELGALGERIAEMFLAIKGYEVVRRNFVFAGREIDLIVRRGSQLVAVEVKLRRGTRFGEAVEAVNSRKLSRIHLALENALDRMDEPLEPRVDLVVIDIGSGMNDMRVRHIEAVS